MIRFFRKFLVYCSSDGIGNALRFAIKTCVNIFYSNSTTIFFRCDELCHAIAELPADMKEFKLFSEEVQLIDLPRLQLLDCKRKFDEGQVLYVVYSDSKPVSFSWTAPNFYKIHGIGKFKLAAHEFWIGPTFVLNRYRGKGLNKKQIAAQMGANGERAVYFTSVNENNLPSIKSFLSLGYKESGRVHKSKVLFHTSISVTGNDLKNKLDY